METTYSCNCCDGPIAKSTVDDKFYCAKGMACTNTLTEYATRILSKGPLAILPPSNIELLSSLLENSKIKHIAEIFNFTHEDWTALAALDYLDPEEIDYIVARSIEVRSSLSITDFFIGVKIPGVVDNSRVYWAIERGTIKLTSERDAKFSIGNLLMNWENYHGLMLGAAGEEYSTDTVLFMNPISTLVEIQKLTHVFIPEWVTDYRKRGEQGVIDDALRRT